MKNTGLILAILLAAASVFAQGRGGMDERHSARLKAELSLTDEQLDQIEEINNDFIAGHRSLRSDTAMSRAAVQRERKKLMDERDAAIRKVLSKEQAEKWEALRKADRERWRSRGEGDNPQKAMKEAVGLSDEQLRKIMEINRKMGADFRTLRSDSATARSERAAAMRTIMEKRNDAIKKVLSDDQYEKFRAFESEKTQHRRKGGQRNHKGDNTGAGRHRR